MTSVFYISVMARTIPNHYRDNDNAMRIRELCVIMQSAYARMCMCVNEANELVNIHHVHV